MKPQERIERSENSRFLTWAQNELAFMHDGDEMNERMANHLFQMCELFAEEHHSGFSAAYAANVLNKLLRWEPLQPLTGEEDEWDEPFDHMETQQNKRCPHVFRRADGTAYDTKGRVFVSPKGHSYTDRNSATPVTFPYTPTVEYIAVDEEGNPI